MVSKPNFKPTWADNDVQLPNAQTSNKLQPTSDLQDQGIDYGQQLTAQEFNWIVNNIKEWVDFFEQQVGVQDAYIASNDADAAEIFTGNSVDVSAYNTEDVYWVKWPGSGGNSTTTPTLDVDGLGAITVVALGGSTLAIGDLQSGHVYPLWYNGTNFVVITILKASQVPYDNSSASLLASTVQDAIDQLDANDSDTTYSAGSGLTLSDTTFSLSGDSFDSSGNYTNLRAQATTAADVGAITSIDGVSNSGGNVDLIGGSNITINPDDANNSITINASDEAINVSYDNTTFPSDEYNVQDALDFISKIEYTLPETVAIPPGTTGDIVSLAPLNNSNYFVLLKYDGSYTLKTYELDLRNSDLYQIGSDTGISNGGSIDFLSQNLIVMGGNGEIKTLKWDGSTWSQEGNIGSTPTGNFSSVASLTESLVAYVNRDDSNLITFQWDGSTWSQIASTAVNTGSFTAICRIRNDRVAFVDTDNSSIRIYEFDGSNWSQVGAVLSNINNSTKPAITHLGNNVIVYADTDSNTLEFYYFLNGSWTTLHNTTLSYSMSGMALAALSYDVIISGDDAADLSLQAIGINSYQQNLEYNPHELPSYQIRAWCNFEGTDTTTFINGQGNIDSVTRTSTGVYDVTFKAHMPDVNYSVTFGTQRKLDSDCYALIEENSYSTTGFTILVSNSSADTDTRQEASVNFQVVR